MDWISDYEQQHHQTVTADEERRRKAAVLARKLADLRTRLLAEIQATVRELSERAGIKLRVTTPRGGGLRVEEARLSETSFFSYFEITGSDYSPETIVLVAGRGRDPHAMPAGWPHSGLDWEGSRWRQLYTSLEPSGFTDSDLDLLFEWLAASITRDAYSKPDLPRLSFMRTPTSNPTGQRGLSWWRRWFT